MRSDHQAGKRNAPKGEIPAIRKTGQRFLLNMLPVISNKGHVEFMILDGSFTGGVFLDFLTSLSSTNNKRYFLYQTVTQSTKQK
jgi:hypothetical protein